MQLVVGLGNPEDKYLQTRHNIGFMVIDSFINNHNTVSINKPQFRGLLYKIKNNLFLKPQTYMNDSGSSIEAVMKYYKIDIADIIVIHDDLDLGFGSLRFKVGGGSGGHNGLKSIDSHIGRDYIRVRLGIGKPSNNVEVINYVLNNFAKDELEELNKTIENANNAIVKLENHTIEQVSSLYSIKK